MIGYPISPEDLIEAINQEKKTWISRAIIRKDAYRVAKAYTGGAEFWGEIKDVFIRLQHEKCAYCEMKLAGSTYGSKVHEVEHFRPKSRVRIWPGAIKRLQSYKPPCATGAGNSTGYYLLAYNPFNYAIACTRCNSSLKSDYFPVRGIRSISEENVGKLHVEYPLLIYPISTIDSDPETLVTFNGVIAVPAYTTGSKFERARVTIDFFDLNHEDLTTRRAETIASLYVALKGKALATNPTDIQEFDEHISSLTSSESAFSACARAFLNLYHNNKPHAIALGKEAQKLRPK